MFTALIVTLGNMHAGIGVLLELFGPVISMELVRTLLSVAHVKVRSIRQGDFKGAFLNASFDNEDDICIRPPNISGTKLI